MSTMDDEILTDALLNKITGKIDGITSAQLSVLLGFSTAQGNNAQIMGFLQLNQQAAYDDILHKYVSKYGTEVPVALKLRLIFRENDMAPCAKIIENELTKRGIPFPSHAEAAIDQSLNLPSPPHQEPGSESASVASAQGESPME